MTKMYLLIFQGGFRQDLSQWTALPDVYDWEMEKWKKREKLLLPSFDLTIGPEKIQKGRRGRVKDMKFPGLLKK